MKLSPQFERVVAIINKKPVVLARVECKPVKYWKNYY